MVERLTSVSHEGVEVDGRTHRSRWLSLSKPMALDRLPRHLRSSDLTGENDHLDICDIRIRILTGRPNLRESPSSILSTLGIPAG